MISNVQFSVTTEFIWGGVQNGAASHETDPSWNLSPVRDMCTSPRDEREHTGW